MKKILLSLLLSLLACACAIGFVACGDNPSVDNFKISFIVDGEEYHTVQTKGDEKITIPKNPEKAGHTFDGWYWDNETWRQPFTANSLLETPIKSDMRVYAKFYSENDLVGTQVQISGFSLVQDDSLGEVYYNILPNSKLIYSLSDVVTVDSKSTWQLSTDVFGTQIITSKTVSLEEGNNVFYLQVKDKNENVKQYIVLIRRRPMYTVTYKLTEDSIAHSIEKVEEGECVQAQPSIKRKGYSFISWNRNLTEPIMEDTIIVANWQANEYTITYNSNGGKIEKISQQVVYANEYQLITPIREGYTFMGWHLSGEKIDDLGVWYYDKSITVSAVWQANIYNIYYDLNGATTVPNNPTTYQTGSHIILQNPERTGYTFVGWELFSEDFTETPTIDFEILSSDFGDKTLRATWQANSYKLTLDANGGIGEKESIEVNYNTILLGMPNATREGYKFLGWYYNDEKCEGKRWRVAGDVTLIARWEAEIYNISYELNGGSSVNSEKYTIEDNIALVEPIKTGHTFLGWTGTGIEDKQLEVTINKTTGDREYTAHWQANEYVITYDGNNGQLLQTETKLFGEEYQQPVPELLKGYTELLGWYTERIGGVKVEINSKISIAKNHTLYAHWNTEVKYSKNGDFYEVTGITENLTDAIILDKYNGVSVTTIGDYAFSDCYSLTSIEIPSSVTSIGSYAFYDCYSLTSIEIPSSVTSIGYRAFSGCYSLTSITLPFVGATLNGTKNTHFGYIFGVSSYSENSSYVPSTLKTVVITGGSSIGNSAFYECSSLTSITIPNSVTSIDEDAFYGCYGLIQKENGVSYVDKWVIDCDISVIQVTLRENTVGIGNSAFEDCSNLTSITIPESVTSIGSGAFSYCDSLTSITIPDSVTSIGQYAFYGCSKLITVTFGENSQLTRIGFEAFYKCSNLTSITIPDSVTSIGEDAFRYCYSLTSIEIPSSVTSIGSSAFYGCDGLKDVYISDIEAWCNIEFSYYHSNPLCYGASLYLNNEIVTELIIPDTATEIKDYAFSGCDSLTSITIPEGVTSIGNSAFYGCSKLIQKENGVSYVDKWVIDCDTSVTQVTLRENTVGIGSGAFSYCDSLTSITIPDSVTSIGQYAFYGCSKLITVTFGENSQLTSIGNYAFYSCSKLITVTFGENSQLTSIGSYAFGGCSKLTTINFNGETKQWIAISKGSFWNYGTGRYTIYCTDGRIAKS